MDSLQLLPLEKWPLLRDSLKRDWPTYAYYYNWVQNAIKWRKIQPEIKQEIYCPNGDHKSGVFFSISEIGLIVVLIFCFEESKESSKEALNNTKILPWNKGIFFSAVQEHFVDVLVEILDEMKETKKIKCIEVITNYYFKSKEDCAKQVLPKVPDECKIKPVSLTDIPLMHSLWPLRDTERPERTLGYFETFVRLNRSVGVYLKKDDSLVSWILHGNLGHLAMLQTVDEHKRKGYGKIVTQLLSRELAVEENVDSVLFIFNENFASEKLFESLDYQRVTKAFWFVTPPFVE